MPPRKSKAVEASTADKPEEGFTGDELEMSDVSEGGTDNQKRSIAKSPRGGQVNLQCPLPL